MKRSLKRDLFIRLVYFKANSYKGNGKEKIDILKKMQKTLVLADDVSHRLCDSSNVVVRVSAPFIDGAQIATHLPLLGEKGTDFLLETIEAYYQTLA